MNKPLYIRSHLDTPTEELAEQLNESLYYVWLCKEVARNRRLRPRSVGPKKFERITEDMKDFLLSLDSDSRTQREVRDEFNRAFADSPLTPLSGGVIVKYRERLLVNSEVTYQ